MSNLTLSDKLTVPCSPSRLGRALRALVPLLALSAAACDDMDDVPHDAELAEPAADDELELIAQAEAAEEAEAPEGGVDPQAPAAGGPDELQAAPSDPVAVKSSLCCEIVAYGTFELYARIRNPGPTVLTECSNLLAGSYPIQYKVHHYYGDPPPVTGVTAPIPLGSSRSIPLSYAGALGAMSCEAWFET